MSNFSKVDLIEEIAEMNGITKSQAEKSVNYTLNGIKSIAGKMKVRDKLRLIGNLSFEVVHREARKGHNPRKPDIEIDIPAKNVLKVKVGSDIAGAVEQPK